MLRILWQVRLVFTTLWARLRARFVATPVGPIHFTVGPEVADQPFGPQVKVDLGAIERRVLARFASRRQRPSRRNLRRSTGGWSGAVAH